MKHLRNLPSVIVLTVYIGVAAALVIYQFVAGRQSERFCSNVTSLPWLDCERQKRRS